MIDQPIEEKLMIEVTVAKNDGGLITIVAHGRLEKRAESVLRIASAGLGELLKAGWRGRVWVDPEYGHIRLNSDYSAVQG